MVSGITFWFGPENAVTSVAVIDFGQMGATAEADAVGVLIVQLVRLLYLLLGGSLTKKSQVGE